MKSLFTKNQDQTHSGKKSGAKLALLLTLGSTAALAAAIGVTSFDLMHTRPECGPDGKSTFCEPTDVKAAAKLSGMETRVAEMVSRAQDPSKASIVIAYFSFSNKAAFAALCERGKAGIPIKGFFDNDYNTPGTLPSDLQAKCQGPTGNNVKVYFAGEKAKNPDGSLKVWRLHHNKFLLVDPGTGEDVNVNFSSGNLSSSGLSVHFDHWGTLTATPDSNLVKQHKCVVEALETAVKGQTPENKIKDDPAKYRSTLDACLKANKVVTDPETLVNDSNEKVAPLFSPNPNNDIYRTLRANIDRVAPGGKIYGAIQHFLHQGIAADLKRAHERGVTVSLIMDDDVVSGGSEVPGVGEFYDDVLAEKDSSGQRMINIRFMKTNSGMMQMMHNKFVVLEGVKNSTTGETENRVFSGAGHFTTSAMKNNYENFYLSKEDGLTAKYQALYKYMLDRSISEEEARNN